MERKIMDSNIYIMILSLLLTTIAVFLFIHMNYKKYSLLFSLNEILMFRKMLFNRKVEGYHAGKKIVISFFCIICYYLMDLLFVGMDNVSIENGVGMGYEMCLLDIDNIFLDKYGIKFTSQLPLKIPSDNDSIIWNAHYIVAYIVVVLIIRLIYELIIIPIAMNSKQKQTYQQGVYSQQINQSPLNTPYSQTNYEVPQNQNVTYIQQAIQPEQSPIASETQFKFCSQCGTRYDATEDNCPNCGMK